MQEELDSRISKKLKEDERKKIAEAIEYAKKKIPDFTEKKSPRAIETLNTLFMLNADISTMVAAVYSQTDISTQEIEKISGKETALIIESKKKFDQTLEKYADTYASNPELKKVLFFSLTKNLKLLLLIVTEKIVVLKKLKKMPKEEATKTAIEAQEILIPLIHKLGIKKIKSKAEDLVFGFLEPEKYGEIFEKVSKKIKQYEAEAEKMRKMISQKAKESKIPVESMYRAKGIYSTYRKMAVKGKKLEEIHDLLAIRLITDSVKECYEILGIVHSLWIPFQEEFDDYIAKPKENNYQSLHTTVLSRENVPIEIQIRTREMDNDSELGVAAHWKYKGETDQKVFDKRITWLNEFLSWQSAKTIQKEVKVNFFGNSIYALTPKGETVELPENSTVLDFAFAIHSNLGEHCVKGKINGVLAPIDQKLENFDVVEIITSPTQHPKVHWLNIARTEKAKTKIKQALQLKQSTKTERLIQKNFGIKSTDKRIKIAKCCKPVPGDEVIGFRTTKRKIAVHRKDCTQTKKFSKNSQVNIDWETRKGMQFSTEIKALAYDRPGMIKALLAELSKNTEKILNANIKQLNESETLCTFEIRATSVQEVETIMEKLKQVNGVKKISRD